jgi:chromate transporter
VMYLQLCWSMFQIGLFSFGGGLVAIPLIKSQIVDLHGWMTIAEFTDIITIAEMTPGPIAINSATFVGMRMGGVPGAVLSTLAVVLAPFVIVITLAKIYYKYKSMNAMQYIMTGLRPAVVAMIAAAGLGILLLAFFGTATLPISWEDLNITAVVFFAVGIFALRKWKVNPIYVIGGSGLAGMIVYKLLGW